MGWTWGGGGYSHFRVCEGSTATFSCYPGATLQVGHCWYGSPSNERGSDFCPHPANGICSPVHGNCGNYIRGQCSGKNSCSVQITNGNMGGDPCRGVYKLAGLTMRCFGPNQGGKAVIEGHPSVIEDAKEGIEGRNNNGYFIELSSTSVYVIATVIVLVLSMNLACLIYSNYCVSKSKRSKYHEGSQISSSDDDMENPEELEI